MYKDCLTEPAALKAFDITPDDLEKHLLLAFHEFLEQLSNPRVGVPSYKEELPRGFKNERSHTKNKEEAGACTFDKVCRESGVIHLRQLVEQMKSCQRFLHPQRETSSSRNYVVT
jgi:hypothetical protein